MTDQIFGGHNFGDPEHSDPQFSMSNMASTIAQNELTTFRDALEDHVIQRLCGPQTLAYYRALKNLANAQKAWGELPSAPASLDQ